jgi:hypothetical protein
MWKLEKEAVLGKRNFEKQESLRAFFMSESVLSKIEREDYFSQWSE